MHVAIGMIVVAALLPYATIVFAKAGAGVDNHAPRRDLAQLTGWRQRADWAHRNHFEAFAPFAAAVIVAELAQVPQVKIDLAAGAFVLCRILYTALYLADLAALRSAVWSLGFIAVLTLFGMSL